MTDEQIKESEKIAQQCMIEINAVLKKHGCSLKVIFNQDVVMGKSILVYEPAVVHEIDK